MNKIALIAQSEYGRRVRTRMFIVTTLLAPLLAIAVVILPVIMTTMSDEGHRHVAIVDETDELAEALAQALPSGYSLAPGASADSLRAQVLQGEVDGFFVLPTGLLDGSDEAVFFSRGSGGLAQQATLQSVFRDVFRTERIRRAGASDDVLGLLDARPALDLVTVSEEGDAAGGAVASSVIAYVLGLLIYVAVLIYGLMVMRGRDRGKKRTALWR